MTGKQHLIAWLRHRVGQEQLSELPVQLRYMRRALDLNSRGKSFVDSFGKKEIKGFAGFVDLVGFSDRVKGCEGHQISLYLKPFLSGVVRIVTKNYGLVDKTIGDEAMFILPDLAEDDGLPAVLLMGHLLGGLHDLQQELGASHPFRIGLSYGRLYVDQIYGDGYSEWTTVGESVNLAKRLQALEGVNIDVSIGGAFGVLIREPEAVSQFQPILNIIAGFASRMTHKGD